jgi:hypothetical protein
MPPNACGWRSERQIQTASSRCFTWSKSWRKLARQPSAQGRAHSPREGRRSRVALAGSGDYFARLHVNSNVIPAGVRGFVNFISSAEMEVTIRR